MNSPDYDSAMIVPDKMPETILNAIMIGRIERYGLCDKILHDLGGDKRLTQLQRYQSSLC